MLQQLKDVFFVSDATASHNIKICNQCPDMVRDTVMTFPVSTCGQMLFETPTTCGCVVDGSPLAKTKLNGFECPQKKWSNIK